MNNGTDTTEGETAGARPGTTEGETAGARPERKRRRLGLRLLAALLVGLALGAAAGYRLLFPGLPFTHAFQKKEGILPADREPFTVEERHYLSGGRSIPVRIYRPRGGHDRAILLLHGVHCDGRREDRLARFSRELAREGHLVVAPDIPDLMEYHIVSRAVADIEAAALFMLDDPAVAAGRLKRKPGLFGISFSGGLGLTAAATPALKGRLGFALSFGGHGDLDRVCRYLSDGQLPEGGYLEPHLYAQCVLARQWADQLVPADQVEELRACLYEFLRERPEAFKAAIPGLGPQAREIAELALRWDAKGMGRRLAPLVAALRTDPALSPLRGPAPTCPVFLIHGSVDNVIPPSETLALGRWTQAAGAPTRELVTELIRHVELEEKKNQKPGIKDTWMLLRFMTEWLRM